MPQDEQIVSIVQVLSAWTQLVEGAMASYDDDLNGTLLPGFDKGNRKSLELLESLGLVERVSSEVWQWADPSPDLAEVAKIIEAS